MIESIILSSCTDDILKRYSLAINEYTLPINSPQVVGMGLSAYVITSESDHELRRMKFGFTPFWAKEPMNLLTARAEGDKNQSNDLYYNGPNSIFLKPAFRKAIQHYRCLVVADGFTDNTSGHKNLFSTNERPSVFAGIYDYWKDPATGIIIPGFALITIPSTGEFREIGISRIPVVLSFFNCANWIRPERPMSYYLPMLDRSRNEIASAFTFGILEQKKTEVTNNANKSNPIPRRYRSKRESRSHYDGPGWAELKRQQRDNSGPQ